MRRHATIAMLLLAGCSAGNKIDSTFNAQAKAEEQAAKERAADSRAVRAGFAPDQPQPLQTVSLDPPATRAPATSLPPAEAQYRYIGLWAVSAAQCEGGVWRLTSRKLSTADKRSCDFSEVSVAPSGYQLRGRCKAGGAESEQMLALSFDERHKTMHVAGSVIGPVDLIYCGN